MNKAYYHAQVRLLLNCLPALNDQDVFALKGGTAINFFVQDFPRLSVDIDLTFVKNLPREVAINAIEEGLRTLGRSILHRNKNYRIQELITQESQLKKLIVRAPHCQIKIEPNFVMRGHLLPVVNRTLKKTVEDHFQFSVKNIPVLAEEELYAGKICAALSRQHPRDLFDVKLLLEQDGITDKIRQAFVVYLVCQNRPIHELLSPNRLDVSRLFQSEFLGMIEKDVGLEELLQVREELIETLHQSLLSNEKAFMVSVKKGAPDYTLMPFENLVDLPALQWKLINIKQMTKNKQLMMLRQLEAILA